VEYWDSNAPADLKGYAPPFVVSLFVPGIIQIWSGLLVSTLKDWSILVGPVSNIPQSKNLATFEGIIETETWFGPLFTNIRLTRTNSPVEFHRRYPLFQVQPLLRECYGEVSFEVVGLSEMSAADWRAFEATIRPNTEQMRMMGHYAVEVRRQTRRKR